MAIQTEFPLARGLRNYQAGANVGRYFGEVDSPTSQYRTDPRRLIVGEANKLRNSLFSSPRAKFVSRSLEQRGRVLGELLADLIVKADGKTIPEIEKAIEYSRYILDLKEDWDGDGSPSYSLETWTTATQFVRRSAFGCWRDENSQIPVPKITHGPDSSIDITWSSGSRSLLMNVVAGNDSPIFFFGSESDRSIKGTIDRNSSGDWLLSWLTK